MIFDKEDFEKASYWRDQVNQLESQKNCGQPFMLRKFVSNKILN